MGNYPDYSRVKKYDEGKEASKNLFILLWHRLPHNLG
jgi:hypothetical protein